MSDDVVYLNEKIAGLEARVSYLENTVRLFIKYEPLLSQLYDQFLDLGVTTTLYMIARGAVVDVTTNSHAKETFKKVVDALADYIQFSRNEEEEDLLSQYVMDLLKDVI